MSKKPDHIWIFVKICCTCLIAAVSQLSLTCSNTTDVSLSGGNTSEVSYAVRGVLYEPGGDQPAENATVIIRTRDYIPEAVYEKLMQHAPEFFSRISRTDSEGHFIFSNIPIGDYVIEGRNGRDECVFIDSVNVDSSLTSDTTGVAPDTLKVPCTIAGSHSFSSMPETTVMVYIPGLDVVDTCDENGRCTLTDLPEGNYYLHFIMLTNAANEEKIVQVKTEAGKTTLIGDNYHIMYSGNGSDSGVVPVDTMEYFIGDSAVIMGKGNLKKTSYTFRGWNTETDGSGVDYLPDTVIMMKAEDVQLFAKWSNQYEMKWIATKGKSFQMGEAGIADTVHTVNFFSDGYWIDSTEVTQSEYEAVMSAAYPGYRRPVWNHGTGPDYPVYNISWYDAVLYCNARTKASGSTDTIYEYNTFTGTPGDTDCVLGAVLGLFMKSGIRLTTEAEWEFACRGGTATRYFWGDDTLKATDYAWYSGNAEQFKPVAQKAPNPFGLYDMIGNAFEICEDIYGVYSQGSVYEPTSPGPVTEANTKTCRGGSWQSTTRELGSANRGKVLVYERKPVNGFRVCRSIK